MTVQSTADDAGTLACSAQGTGYSCPTLRDAVNYADAGSAGTDPTIELGSHVYALSGSELDVGVPMTIAGNGPSGAGASVIEQLTPGARVISVPIDSASLTLEDLEVTGGRLVSSNGSGAQSCDPSSGQAFGGGICSEGPLTLIDLAVSGNQATGAAGDAATLDGDPAVGGAIYATDGLSLTDSTVSGNTTQGGAGYAAAGSQPGGAGGEGGGAIAADGVTVTGSTISGNHARGGAGGAGGSTAQTSAPGAGGEATGALIGSDAQISASTIAGNVGVAGAGGAAVEAGVSGGPGGTGRGGGVFALSATVSETFIWANSITGGAGGAAAGPGGAAGPADGGGLDLIDNLSSVVSSTISGNQAQTGTPGTSAGGPASAGSGATAHGGGLAVGSAATATLVNSTVFANTVSAPAGSATGGGVSADGAGSSLGLASDTLDANQVTAAAPADASGGSLNSSAGAAVTVQDSILAGARPAGLRNCQINGGTLSDAGHNLEDDAAGCGFSAGVRDLVGSNPELPLALGGNGGPTQTLAPAPGSPVIRAGGACTDPTLSPPGPLATDQRGDLRGASCDIGAFQTEPLVVTGAPVLSGRAVTGSVVGCAQGSFGVTGDGARSSSGAIGPPAIAYSWLLNGKAIRGASAGTFRIPEADVHAHLSCRKSATGAYGKGSATSGTAKVAALAPTVSKPAQSHRSWRETGKRAGTTFTFTLNEAARVTLSFRRGRRAAGAITLNGRQGRNARRFAGRLSRRHRLRPGRYTLTLRATADGLRSRARTLTFTIR